MCSLHEKAKNMNTAFINRRGRKTSIMTTYFGDEEIIVKCIERNILFNALKKDWIDTAEKFEKAITLYRVDQKSKRPEL